MVIVQLLISVPGAYAFEMSRFRYKESLFFLYIVVMLMPLQVVLVPVSYTHLRMSILLRSCGK